MRDERLRFDDEIAEDFEILLVMEDAGLGERIRDDSLEKELRCCMSGTIFSEASMGFGVSKENLALDLYFRTGEVSLGKESVCDFGIFFTGFRLLRIGFAGGFAAVGGGSNKTLVEEGGVVIAAIGGFGAILEFHKLLFLLNMYFFF